MRTVYPNLSWVENPTTETEELLYRLSRREFDYTVADSNEFAIGRAFHPEIRVAFDLSGGKALAWAVDTRDASLLKRVTAFFSSAQGRRSLSHRSSRRTTATRIASTTSSRGSSSITSKRACRNTGTGFARRRPKIGVDWRLLAAIGYQESHWDPTATSPTGVRGLMMLTEQTARALDVTDRLDPRASIFGGARYFVWIRNQIPQRILEPDRTWFTLAAYNVGMGHLEDARILTQMHGKNPDSWNDVREHLPLLTQSKWYTRVKRGYARGWEPVRFVENIRSYMDILDWVATESGPPAQREDQRICGGGGEEARRCSDEA